MSTKINPWDILVVRTRKTDTNTSIKWEVSMMSEIWKATIVESFNRFLGKVLIFLPNLLAMITILILGFFDCLDG
jgi:hypothetical protein